MRLIDADEIYKFIEAETDCHYMTCRVCEKVNPSLFKVCRVICSMPASYEPEEEVQSYDG